MEVYPEKGTVHVYHIMHYAHDAVYRPFLGGIPPSTEKLLLSFLNTFILLLQVEHEENNDKLKMP